MRTSAEKVDTHARVRFSSVRGCDRPLACCLSDYLVVASCCPADCLRRLPDRVSGSPSDPFCWWLTPLTWRGNTLNTVRRCPLSHMACYRPFVPHSHMYAGLLLVLLAFACAPHSRCPRMCPVTPLQSSIRRCTRTASVELVPSSERQNRVSIPIAQALAADVAAAPAAAAAAVAGTVRVPTHAQLAPPTPAVLPTAAAGTATVPSPAPCVASDDSELDAVHTFIIGARGVGFDEAVKVVEGAADRVFQRSPPAGASGSTAGSNGGVTVARMWVALAGAAVRPGALDATGSPDAASSPVLASYTQGAACLLSRLGTPHLAPAAVDALLHMGSSAVQVATRAAKHGASADRWLGLLHSWADAADAQLAQSAAPGAPTDAATLAALVRLHLGAAGHTAALLTALGDDSGARRALSAAVHWAAAPCDTTEGVAQPPALLAPEAAASTVRQWVDHEHMFSPSPQGPALAAAESRRVLALCDSAIARSRPAHRPRKPSPSPTDKARKPDPKASQRPAKRARPNYFLSLRLEQPEAWQRVDNVQRAVTTRQPALEPCVVPSRDLHVTMALLALRGDDVAVAAEVSGTQVLSRSRTQPVVVGLQHTS